MPGYGIEGEAAEFAEIRGSRGNALKVSRAGPLRLRWSAGNTKTGKTFTIVFDLPAFMTCPGAGLCASYCLARGVRFISGQKAINTSENFAASKRKDFSDRVIKDLRLLMASKVAFRDKTVTPGSVRLHASGDFYSQDYLDKWFEVMRALPTVKFYAYTKSLHLDWSKAPRNFLRVQSFGGKWDRRIDTRKHHALLFKSQGHLNKVNAERKKRGLPLYAYGSGVELPAKLHCDAPTHIALVSGKVKTGGAKKKVERAYEGVEWRSFWNRRELMNPVKKWEGEKPTSCQVCHKPFGKYFYDAPSVWGSWGLLCESCWFEGSRGGQKYDTKTLVRKNPDDTEDIRREMVAQINAERAERARLEEEYGRVWNTDEVEEEFSVEGFMAPFVVVTRKADGVRGSLMFQHNPRFYFNFQADNPRSREERDIAAHRKDHPYHSAMSIRYDGERNRTHITPKVGKKLLVLGRKRLSSDPVENLGKYRMLDIKQVNPNPLKPRYGVYDPGGKFIPHDPDDAVESETPCSKADKMFKKERKEHPTLPAKTIKRIVKDHLGNPAHTVVGRKCLEIRTTGGSVGGNFGQVLGLSDGSVLVKGLCSSLPGGRVKAVVYLDEEKARREGLNAPNTPWKHDFSSLDVICSRVRGGLLLKSKAGHKLWENR